MKIAIKIGIVIGIGFVLGTIQFGINSYYNYRLELGNASLLQVGELDKRIMQGIILEKQVIATQSEKQADERNQLFIQAQDLIRTLEQQNILNFQDQLGKMREAITESQNKFTELFRSLTDLNRQMEAIRDVLFQFNNLAVSIIGKAKEDIGLAMMNVEKIDENIRNISELAMTTQFWMQQINLVITRELLVRQDEAAYKEEMKKIFQALGVQQKNAEIILPNITESQYRAFLTKMLDITKSLPEFSKKFLEIWNHKNELADQLEVIHQTINGIRGEIIRSGKSEMGIWKNNLLKIQWSVLIVLAVLYVFIVIGFLNSMKSVFATIEKFAHAIAQGDLSQDLDLHRNDEIGSLSKSLENMKNGLKEMIRSIIDSAGSVNGLADELSGLSDSMATEAVTMTEKTHVVATATEQMSANMNQIATSSEQVSNSVRMVATATEEMATTINEIAMNAEKAHSITDDAVIKGKRVSEEVQKLGVAADEIGQVTEFITEISEQTNLLALNATIEAARAGESGKGFAVVANEIKELARQTPEATKNIREKIQGIQKSMGQAVVQMGQIFDIINTINEVVAMIATAVEQQSVTTKEIAANISGASSGIEEVNQGVSQCSSVANDLAREISHINQSTKDMSSSIGTINHNANQLANLAAKLKALTDQFKV